jgi:hypothetical protein
MTSETETRKVHRYDDTDEAWKEFIEAMHSGESFECDEEMFDYWLEVLPPVLWKRKVKLPNGETVNAAFGFAEGADVITVFWFKNGRYFGCRTNIRNSCA